MMKKSTWKITQTSNHQNYGHFSKPKRLASTNPCTNLNPTRDGREGDDLNFSVV